jgi:hypothetical protein
MAWATMATMRKYNFDVNIIETIEALYRMATSAVLVNNEICPFLKTTVGVRTKLYFITSTVQYLPQKHHAGDP